MVETTETGQKALLLTRPLAQSREFLARVAEALGEEPRAVISPLTELRSTGAEVPAEGALILTSGRATEAAGDALRGRMVYCVGDRTAALARAAGAEALSAGGDVDALVGLVLRHRPARVTHLRGTHSVGDVAGRLAAARIEAGETIVYETLDRELEPAALALLRSDAAILAPVFSARGGRMLVDAAGPPAGRLVYAAISPAAAEALAPERTSIAETPDAAAMARLVLRLWRNLP